MGGEEGTDPGSYNQLVGPGINTIIYQRKGGGKSFPYPVHVEFQKTGPGLSFLFIKLMKISSWED